MASTFKTFRPGEVLTAEDVNNALNPSTADHVPRAVAADVTLINATGSPTSQYVALPAGRFTDAPVVTISLNGSTGQEHLYHVKTTSPTKNGFTIHLFALAGAGSATLRAHWHAIQM